MNESAPPTRAQLLMGDFAPELADLTDDVLFGRVWERDGLSPRDRSLITIASLVTSGSAAQLRGHISRGIENGLTQEEIAETITHLAFYAGWPNAMSAVSVARDILD